MTIQKGAAHPVRAREIFTPDEATQIAVLLKEAHRAYLHDGEDYAIRGDIDEDGLLVLVDLALPDRSEVSRFEVGALLAENQELALVDLRAAAVEFVSAWLLTWLRDGRLPRPHLEFKDYRWEDANLRFRGEVRNDLLVAEADRLLREAGFDPDE